MRAWSLRRRLAASVAVLGVLLIGLVITAFVLLVQVRAKQNQVINRYYTAVSTSDNRFIAQINAETAVRGYALTGDPVTLQPLRDYRSATYSDQGNRLRGLLHGDSAALAAFAKWETASQTWAAESAAPTIVDVKANGPGSVSTASVLEGKKLFDANRAMFAAYSRQLVSKRSAASSALRLRTTILFAAVVFMAFSVALASAALWWGLRRWVVDPLAALGGEARMVREGALNHEVTVHGPKEVRELAANVDNMRRDIVDQLAEVETARVEIEASRQRLEKQAAELARSNRDLEQFAYVASHDLQEPLRKVASFCQMLERRYSGQLDERADQYIAFAVDGAKRMQQLINDLLAFSRVGRVTAETGNVNLRDCLDAALDDLSVVVEASGLRVTADYLPSVSGERGLLTQLFQNLIANAIKFRSADAPHVHIGVQRSGDFWEFSCADNGLGIEPQYAERIFVIFQRLHGKDEYAGTGIGLALCKRIVEHYGGQIWLDTTVSSGATFRWTLPLPAHLIGNTDAQPQQEIT